MNEGIVPKNLEECFIEIDKLWDENAKKLIKKDSEDEFVDKTHSNVGRSIRNDWELWVETSNLTKYFANMGVTDADYISSLILRSYHRKLLGKQLNLEEQIKKISSDKESIQNKMNQ